MTITAEPTSSHLITVERDGEVIFSLSPDGEIRCEPENYAVALIEICHLFVRAAS